jgi:hypothetical protein
MRTFFFKKIVKYLNKNFEHLTTNDSTIWVMKDKVIATLDKDSFEVVIDVLKEALL